MEINTYKMDKAQAVLSLVKIALSEKVVKDISAFVGAYQNGREQGFSVSVYGAKTRYASFAECRNSDQIVVYTSDSDPMQSISDKMYHSASYFGYNDYTGAADFIISHLLS